jgi:hypothetical protein
VFVVFNSLSRYLFPNNRSFSGGIRSISQMAAAVITLITANAAAL